MNEGARPIRTGNRLLDRLPDDVFKRLVSESEMFILPQGKEICRQDGPLTHVYFPVTGVCSVVSVTDDGRIVEGATVGKEGMVGISAVFGLDFSPSKAISQVSGKALRIDTTYFLEIMHRGGPLDRIMRRYMAFRLRHAYQTGACNALHSLEERMCRWLLMTHDRVGEAEFELTQEFLAEMLAVRRQSVTVVAGVLQSAGLIQYRRGRLRILNREGLEEASCECYQTTESYYDRIMA